MATKKLNSYIEMELTWLEGKAEELRAYCDSNNIASIGDRFVNGKLTATTETQIKCLRETLQDYIKIVDAIDKLREKEASKKMLSRGDQELSPLEKGEI